jgi:hypothetical protein
VSLRPQDGTEETEPSIHRTSNKASWTYLICFSKGILWAFENEIKKLLTHFVTSKHLSTAQRCPVWNHVHLFKELYGRIFCETILILTACHFKSQFTYKSLFISKLLSILATSRCRQPPHCMCVGVVITFMSDQRNRTRSMSQPAVIVIMQNRNYSAEKTCRQQHQGQQGGCSSWNTQHLIDNSPLLFIVQSAATIATKTATIFRKTARLGAVSKPCLWTHISKYLKSLF